MEGEVRKLNIEKKWILASLLRAIGNSSTELDSACFHYFLLSTGSFFLIAPFLFSFLPPIFLPSFLSPFLPSFLNIRGMLSTH